jgi:hypothetical protein
MNGCAVFQSSSLPIFQSKLFDLHHALTLNREPEQSLKPDIFQTHGLTGALCFSAEPE